MPGTARDATVTDQDAGPADPRAKPIETTAAAMLGLLALRPWTTYELAKQAQRSLQWFWPRAERKLYDEPKKLVQRGLATSEVQRTGRRRSTVYSITPLGRQALREWLSAPPRSAPSFELEQLVRVFFADQGSTGQLLGAVRNAGAQAEEALADLGTIVAAAEQDDAVLRDRDAINAIGLRLVLDLHQTIARWAAWAEDAVGEWDDTRQPRWDAYREVFAEAATYARPPHE